MKELKSRTTKAASRFLDRRGYTVLETGWTSSAGTADIIAEDGGALVFVQVQARDSSVAGFPAEQRGASERARRERIALAYLAEHDAVDMPIRFDTISMVVVGPDRAMIRHHINAMCEAGLLDDALPEAA